MPDDSPRTLSVLTLNTWFKDAHRATRLAAQLDLLESCDADVIGLQEVTADLLAMLEAQPWVRDRYALPADPAKPLQSHGYGLSLLVKRSLSPSFSWRPFELSSMGRGLLSARLPGGLVVATTHLESMRVEHAARTDQLRECEALLADAGTAVLMGDFNFDDDDERPSPLGPFMDLWPVGRPHDPGYTADELADTMARRERTPQRRRIDRVALWDRTGAWRLREIDVVADQPVVPGVWPSDHFGVAATLRRAR